MINTTKLAICYLISKNNIHTKAKTIKLPIILKAIANLPSNNLSLIADH